MWTAAALGSQTFIGAAVAVALFETSRLPKDTLKLIWSLADTEAPKGVGKLNASEFFVALKLIASNKVVTRRSPERGRPMVAVPPAPPIVHAVCTHARVHAPPRGPSARRVRGGVGGRIRGGPPLTRY